MRSQRKRRVEETNFGCLEDIPKGKKGICWDFNDGACKYGDKCGFGTSAKSMQAIIHWSPVEGLVLQRKDLLAKLLVPIRWSVELGTERNTCIIITFNGN